ncbi:hypothetical protein [Massiliimalia massiliensis]|uniref:hypothetical protein n=1 Tax=Massiliimalia massiliensis TaxID=1852384 RepID=UPI000984181B|nr:hypothetical protein [Massiliimalia massiliensis]
MSKTITRVSAFLFSVLMVCTMSVGVFAEEAPPISDEPDVPVTEEIDPRFSYIIAATSTIGFKNGQATAGSTLDGKKSLTTKITIYTYLQQYKNGTWISIGGSSKTTNSYYAYNTYSKTITKGYKYRTKSVFYVYSGSNLETHTNYSKEATYN